ncbi:MAG: glucose-1-phosphate adenylyltransferase [Chloroflexota bacterium]|nr:MAG: glucose-1-phosphate adenylyltransferase [Chloroflexota bacterium]
MPSINDVLAVILGGGAGHRLYPLTRDRSKPAVPIAGKYRLIDVPISNCINSGIQRVAILTQYNSVSLNRHIASTYRFDAFHQGWVEILAAEQTLRSTSWYQGTADAVRKQLFEIQASRARYVLILAGDQLYRMDYEALIRFHWEMEADITVAVKPVPASDAGRLGILKRSKDGRITDFVEKPKEPGLLARFASRDDPDAPYLGSMGIYLFQTDILVELLEDKVHDDFGGGIIPAALSTHRTCGFEFEGYWEDLGTIRSFYETNLSLAMPDTPFDFHEPERPIYTHARFLPGSVVSGASLQNVLMADGCTVGKAEIRHSIIGLRSQVSDGVVIRDSILMGADYYETPGLPARSPIPLGIGPNCQIEGAIIDKNARLGQGVIIRPFPRGAELDYDLWVVRDGIVVIPKSTTIPEGTVIAPES